MNYTAELDTLFDDVSNRAKSLKEREPITFLLDSLLEQIAKLAPPDLVAEVGAFEASFSTKMKTAFPEVSIIALEANPRVFEHFAPKVLPSGVNYIHCAAGAEHGTVDIHIPTVIAGKDMPTIGRMGSLLEVGLRDSKTIKVKVPCDTLDNILAEEVFQNACVWIDVEGFVAQVLRGATSTLQRTQIIYVELESSPVWEHQTLSHEVIETLQSTGFTMIARDCQKWFQYNAIFVRDETLGIAGVQELIKKYISQAKALFLTTSS